MTALPPDPSAPPPGLDALTELATLEEVQRSNAEIEDNAAKARKILDEAGVSYTGPSVDEAFMAAEKAADVLAGRPLRRKRICRTFSDCTTAPRNGLPSGCYPLDDFYKQRPEYEQLKRIKTPGKEKHP